MIMMVHCVQLGKLVVVSKYSTSIVIFWVGVFVVKLKPVLKLEKHLIITLD
jgi:hypothetical protein